MLTNRIALFLLVAAVVYSHLFIATAQTAADGPLSSAISHLNDAQVIIMHGGIARDVESPLEQAISALRSADDPNIVRLTSLLELSRALVGPRASAIQLSNCLAFTSSVLETQRWRATALKRRVRQGLEGDDDRAADSASRTKLTDPFEVNGQRSSTAISFGFSEIRDALEDECSSDDETLGGQLFRYSCAIGSATQSGACCKGMGCGVTPKCHKVKQACITQTAGRASYDEIPR